MPSIEESRRRVQEQLDRHDGVDHDGILAGLQDGMDKHNAIKDDVRRSMRKERASRSRGHPTTSTKFRFKENVSDPRKRKHRSRHDEKHRKSRRTRDHDQEPIHPFPREPTQPHHDAADPADAFRESLFDALADDEGAEYWEGVYNQPIHIYPRPTVQTAKGELEEMNDEEYAAYVKTKMWEKKNPHIMLERERSERKRKQAEEARTREREEFIRKKQQTAWQRAQSYRDKGGEDYDYVAGDEARFAADNQQPRPSNEKLKQQYSAAWTLYSKAWDELKQELLRSNSGEGGNTPASTRIPWPLLHPSTTIPPTKPNIEAFLHYCPATGPDRLRTLKAERVRWHPDKVQQRFRGTLDAETMKVVTSVFQVVDAFLERERKSHHHQA